MFGVGVGENLSYGSKSRKTVRILLVYIKMRLGFTWMELGFSWAYALGLLLLKAIIKF